MKEHDPPSLPTLLEQVIPAGVTRFHSDWVGLAWPDDKHSSANYDKRATLLDMALLKGWVEAQLFVRGYSCNVIWELGNCTVTLVPGGLSRTGSGKLIPLLQLLAEVMSGTSDG